MAEQSNQFDSLLTPYTTHLIDQKGNLFDTGLSLDTKNEILSIITHESADLPSNSTLLDTLFQRFLSVGEKQPKPTYEVNRRHRDSTTSIAVKLKKGIQIPLSEIKEIRLLEYDSKWFKVSSNALKKLKPVRTGGVKNCENKFRVLKILCGMEFNLQCYQFIVIGLEEFGRKKHHHHLHSHLTGQKCELESWADQVISMVNRVNNQRRYFEKLDKWCYTQFKSIMEPNNHESILTLWLRFIQQNHGFIYPDTVPFLENTSRRKLATSGNSPMEFHEFETVARYFIHSHSSASKIFQHFIPNLVVPLEEQVDREENENELDMLLGNFFSYILTIPDDHVPKYNHDMHKISVTVKETITRFAEKFQQRCTNQVIQENWLSSFYVLDYLYSKHNNIWSPEKLEIYQDMTQPLSHYFIASSHNTYLTGNQYSSQSSCEAYVRVLRQGCRCIEIDVWNGSKNKPVVKHGHTITSAVRLKDVLYAIKDHAFVASPYPVIISIENHCSVKQQKVMAKYFWRVFGKMLYTGKGEESKSDEINECKFKSPEELKYKIVLKGSTLPTPQPKRTGSFKKDIRNSIRRLKSLPHPNENRVSDSSTASHGSNFVEANASEYLLIGELWMNTGDGSQKWASQIFLLNNKTMICIEERVKTRRAVSRLPSNSFVRQSMASVHLLQEVLLGQLWFHGKLVEGESDVATLLNKEDSVPGSFLVSESLFSPGDCVLSIFYPNGYTCGAPEDDLSCAPKGSLQSEDLLEDPNQNLCGASYQGVPNQCFQNNVCHLEIKSEILQENGRILSEPVFYLHEGLTFYSIVELMEYYMSNPLRTPNIQLDHLGPPIPVSVTHEAQEWFYKNMDHATSEQLLKNLPINGLFLARYKAGAESEIVISFHYENLIKHCRIKRNGRYLEISNMKFRKLEDLVKYFQENAIYKNVKLAHPLCNDLYEKAINGGDSLASVCKDPKYLNSAVKYENTCRVRAIQSYTTSEPDVLSFKKGDIIVNVVKEADGWWQGMKEDCVVSGPPILKQFCSSFVEEINEPWCPFEDYVGKSTWELGVKVKMESCSSKSAKEFGIKHYIVFDDAKGNQRKLGTTCPLVAKEWADMISFVLEENDDLKHKLHQKQNSKRYKIAGELSDLIWLPNMRKYAAGDGVETRDSKLTNKHSGVKSMEETVASVTFRENTIISILYSQDALTRIYPKRFRLNSSNFNPVPFWNFGSQLVALNYQTPDKGMQINRGKFRQNGNCGYVLKPNFFLPKPEGGKLFDPTAWSEAECQMVVTVEVIGARHLVKATPGTINPVVQVEVFGVDADFRKVQTSRQEGGLNPYWVESFKFQIHCPELALIQFSVYDEDTFSDKLFLGEATIPVLCARQGYRSVLLNNAYGSELFSRLLVKLSINDLGGSHGTQN